VRVQAHTHKHTHTHTQLARRDTRHTKLPNEQHTHTSTHTHKHTQTHTDTHTHTRARFLRGRQPSPTLRSGNEDLDLSGYSVRPAGGADKLLALAPDAAGAFVVRAHSSLRVYFSAGLGSEKEQAALLAQEAKLKVRLGGLEESVRARARARVCVCVRV
jgi:hypothetical protein